MAVTYQRLLAKSSKTPDSPRPAETLEGHLRDVTQVGLLLAERWGDRYLESLGLDPSVFGDRLRLALPRAAFLHDFGKANDHFQGMIRNTRNGLVQAAWHDHLSVWLMLTQPSLAEWLLAGCHELTRTTILAAAAGHHLRIVGLDGLTLRKESGAMKMQLLTGHPDFGGVLKSGAELLGLGEPPRLRDVQIDLIEQRGFTRPLAVWYRQLADWWEDEASAEEKRFYAAVRGLVIAADVAGSAVPRMPDDPRSWTEDVLARVVRSNDVDKVVAARLDGKEPREFQRRVADSRAPVTFVRAGCGTGKTAAAYLWAAQRAAGRKLFVCYPTTGTATQGYGDYVPPNVTEAALIHGRAGADLDDLLTSGGGDHPHDAKDGLDDEGRGQMEWLIRYQSLAAWRTPVTICTVDTVLGLITNSRRGLFAFPAIANGAFVFDEIHQYDDLLFGALLRFLEALPGAPMLLMTASLPAARLAELEQVMAKRGERLEIIDGPADLEQMPRYQVQRSGREAAWEEVERELKRGGRVLWVCNTVDRTVKTAQEAEKRGLHGALTYHARFRYDDRQKRHEKVVQAFASDAPGGVLAVTNQVCEVSLDMSATLLVTELAPIPALIQRLGRLNRWTTPDAPGFLGRALVIDPPDSVPYKQDELDRALVWLASLGDGALSQAKLAEAFQSAAGEVGTPRDARESHWLDGGARAVSGPLRAEGYTVSVLREEDVPAIKARPVDEQGIAVIRNTIPMLLGPVSRQVARWERLRGVLVAPAGRMKYTLGEGGSWM